MIHRRFALPAVAALCLAAASCEKVKTLVPGMTKSKAPAQAPEQAATKAPPPSPLPKEEIESIHEKQRQATIKVNDAFLAERLAKAQEDDIYSERGVDETWSKITPQRRP